jgi:hypothetical protein
MTILHFLTVPSEGAICVDLCYLKYDIVTVQTWTVIGSFYRVKSACRSSKVVAQQYEQVLLGLDLSYMMPNLMNDGIYIATLDVQPKM